MKRKAGIWRLGCVVLIFLAGSPALADAPFSTVVGETRVIFPAPETGMCEVGQSYREGVMKRLYGQTMDLLAGYLPCSVVANLPTDRPTGGFERWAMVTIDPRDEYARYSAAYFGKFLAQMRSQLADGFIAKMNWSSEDFLSRAKAAGAEIERLEIGSSVQLGTFLDTDDAFAFGWVMQVETDMMSRKVGGAMAVVLVKGKIVFLYLYRYYDGLDSLAWLRQTMISWVKELRRANRSQG